MKARNKMDPHTKKILSGIIMVFIMIMVVSAFAYMVFVYLEREALLEELRENKNIEMAAFSFNSTSDKLQYTEFLFIDGMPHVKLIDGSIISVCFDNTTDKYYSCEVTP